MGNGETFRLTPDDRTRLALDFFTPDMDLIEFIPGNPDDGLGTLRIRSIICGVSEYSTIFTSKRVLTMNLLDRDAGCGYLPTNLKGYLAKHNTQVLAEILSAYDRAPSPPRIEEFDLSTNAGMVSWQIRLLQHYKTPIALMKGALPDLNITGVFRQAVVAAVAREISVAEDPNPYAFSLSDASIDLLIGGWSESLQAGINGTIPSQDDLIWFGTFITGIIMLGDEERISLTPEGRERLLAFSSEIQIKLMPIEPLTSPPVGGLQAPTGSASKAVSEADVPAPPLPPEVLEPGPDLRITGEVSNERTFPWESGLSTVVGGGALLAIAAGLRDHAKSSHAFAAGGAALAGFGCNELANYLFPDDWWSQEAGSYGSVGVGILAGGAGFGVNFSMTTGSVGPVVVTEPKPVAVGTDSGEGQRGGRGTP